MLFETMADVEVGKSAGAWLKAQREAEGLSRRDVAERVGLTYHIFVDHVEAGNGRIRAEELTRWADALRVERVEFVKRLRGFDDAPRRVEAELVEA
ncbi:hypothetical protein KL86APRO_11174 [uncultured Alphaproteobacteria bacterium]|uniref:HTH cro/C1-type domain-containing protein n=1 Tax=uncultured Alphaproteobacteria bacterium TaxID=91750 RepID=A0A212JJA3_9PROT|nr:hypothetical protein KL86APRO_11174 [uncultured Alphaproteobacteria bacterium]